MEPCRFNSDPDEIARAINLLFEPDSVVELRVLKADRAGTVSGYFDGEHRAELLQTAEHWSGKAPGVYVTLNPVDPPVAARSLNRAKSFAKDTTKDNEILRRVWLPIDFDPKRPSGISSTDAQHHAALVRARECRDYLRGLGWPDPILADSGNGAHLLYPVSLPNNPESTDLVKGSLESLASRFSDSVVDVDKKVFNAARIWKLYGTLSAKGDHTPDRPHRIARILEVPQVVDIVPIDVLKALSAMQPSGSRVGSQGDDSDFSRLVNPRRSGDFDIRKWAEEHKVPVVQWKPFADGGTLGVLALCPWNPDHTNLSAYIGQLVTGAPFAACHHNSCADKGFNELRDVVEPGWRDRVEDFKPIEAVHDPHRLSRFILDSKYSHPDGSILRYHRGLFFRWDGSAYRELPLTDLDAHLTDSIKREFDRDSIEAQRRGDEKRRTARQVSTTIVTNVKQALRSRILVPSEVNLPCWMDGEGPWNAAEVLPAPNGLFLVPSLAEGFGDGIKPTPRFFSTFVLDYEIDLKAPSPVAWLEFMEDIWEGDMECVATLQEWMGYVLTQDTWQQKILMMIGPTRSGKGTIARVMGGLIGKSNVSFRRVCKK